MEQDSRLLDCDVGDLVRDRRDEAAIPLSNAFRAAT